MRCIPLRNDSMTSPSTSTFSSLSAITPSLALDHDDVRSLRTLLALLDVELDLRALVQRAEAAADDAVEVDEDILGASVLRGDEAVPLLLVEPLDGSFCHKNTSLPQITN